MANEGTLELWHVDSSKNYPTVIRDSSNAGVAYIGGFANGKVNAPKIAAAPEMLEMLETMDKWLSQYKHYGVALNIVTQARAVIAKAKGE